MTYAGTVAADNPVAWWKLDETSGTSAADSGSGTAANGTYTGGYTLGYNGVNAADSGGGSAVLLNGSSGYITVGSLPAKLQFTSGSAFSIEAWFAFSDLTSNASSLVCEGFAGDNTVRYQLGFFAGSASRKPTFGWYNGSWRTVQSATAIDDCEWHHAVGTFDGTQHRLYVDGSLVAGPTTPGGTQPGGTETLYLGRRWDTSSPAYFPGFLDEVAIYNVALSSTQVSDHYSAMNLAATQARVTDQFAEVLVGASSLPVRVTDLFIEVVVEATNPTAYWGTLAKPLT